VKFAPSPDRQPLNPLDVAMHCVDRSIRGMGYPGFQTQMLVWLTGRIDIASLRRGIVRLARRHPAITARLVEGSSADSRSYWEFRPDAEAALQEVHLPSADASEVLACAAELQSAASDPAMSEPLRFHVLHRPGGRDVLAMQYSHILMDNSAAGLVLRDLERLSAPLEQTDDPPSCVSTQVLNRHVRRFPHADRRAAALRAIELQAHSLRGRASILGTGEEDKPRRAKLQIATRWLASDVVRAIHNRTVALCGFPNISMAILASVFRAIRELGGDRNVGRNYIAGIGLDLNLRRGRQPPLQNLLSIVPIIARPEQLDNQQQLVQILSRQMRERLESKFDLGVLRLATVFQRRPRHIRWVAEHLLRWGYSLWYAYFGSSDSLGHRLWNLDVEKICYVGPTWSPMGISLLANQFRGQLFFQATYDPDLVSEPLANEFLDRVLSGLCNFAAA
jgi:hypothetical protein